MNKIAVLCPYFGKFPKNISVTLDSMAKNEFITWFLLTDSGEEYVEKYPNIKIVRSSFEEIKILINSKIGTSISSPYKLCDYKPTYGDVFETYFRGYDFWGYYDLDVIYGDLSKFITESKLKIYDKIYDLGHFSIYRNTHEICRAYRGNNKVCVPYKEILNAKCICVFDETYDEEHEGINGILCHMGYKIYSERSEFADISVVWKNFSPNNTQDRRRDYFFEYDNGTLVMRKKAVKEFRKEVAYVHLQQKKEIPVMRKNCEHYLIMPKGYIDLDKSIDKYFYFYDMHWWWYLQFRFRRKYSKIKGLKDVSIDVVYK